MYCLSLNPLHLELIKKIGYIPVGLGSQNFTSEWYQDNVGKNISSKNPHYGEYTFHYWLWKNNQLKFDNWVGFCQYRKFWKKDNSVSEINNFTVLNSLLLREIPKHLENYESILGENFYINKLKFSKLIKHNFKTMVLNPNLFFDKSKRTIKFHFDMMHGHGNLERAINLLDSDDREDFRFFVNTEVSFNPQNMFICKKQKILLKYYETLFPWLERCEKLFGFEKLKGYGLKRIYGFLAERYMSFWFKKHTNFTILPIQFKDISDYL